MDHRDVLIRHLYFKGEEAEDQSEVRWKSLTRVPLFDTPWTYSPWDSPGKNTGVGTLSLLQGIFPTQGLNLGLPHCRQIVKVGK